MSSSATLTAVVALVIASLIVIGAGSVRPESASADQPVPPPPVDAAPPGVELTDLRTAETRTFAAPDGSYVTQFFTEPVHYQPEGRTDWQPIDTSFGAVNRGVVKAAVDTSPARLALAAADASEFFLLLSGAGQSIGLRLPTGVPAGRANTQPVVKEDGAYVEYADFLPGGIALRVFPHVDGFKSFLVLYSRPAVNAFSLAIDAPGLSLAANVDGSIAFTDSADNVVGRIPRPYLLDSSEVEGRGGGLYSEAVTQTASQQRDGTYLLTLTVEPAFFDSAVYPVYLDPTVTDFPTPNTTAQDTFASSKYPNSNFNTYQRPDAPFYYEMWHGKEPGTSYYNEVYIRFKELRPTLGTVKIEDARLEIYPYWQYYHYQGRPTWIRRVLEDWGGGSLTWNNRPAVDTVDMGPYLTTEDEWSHIDLTSFVQAVVNDDIDNHGVMLHASETGQGNWKRFVSRNDTHTPDYKPHLSVSWSPFVPFAVEPNGSPSASRTLVWGHDLTAADTTSYQVELATSSSYGGTIVASSGTISGTSTSWTVPGGVNLTNNSTHHWHVRAKYGVNTTWSAWSDNVSFTYQIQLPIAWTEWPDYDWTDDRTLEWAYGDGDGDGGTNTPQAQYQVQVATDDAFTTILADSGVLSSASARSWTIPGGVSLSDGTIYYWRIKVSDGSVWSDWVFTEFGWGAGDEGPGIDPEGDDAYDGQTAEELGFSPLFQPETIDYYCEDDECEPPGGAPPPPSADSLDDIAVFHQLQKKWCVPATMQTMLKWITKRSTYSADGTLKAQKRLRNLLLAVKWDADHAGTDEVGDFYANPYGYTPKTSFGRNGIGTNIGWQALNEELRRAGKPHFAQLKPASAIKLGSTAVMDIHEESRPVFVEVDIRKSNWVWHSAGSSRSTHATAIIGYASSGQLLDVADPFWALSQNITPTANGSGELHFSPNYYNYMYSDDDGSVWNDIPRLQLFRAMDTAKAAHKPVWY